MTMNENLDLSELLKDCPKGTNFYSSTYGEVEFLRIEDDDINPITIKWTNKNGNSYLEYLTKEGTFRGLGECIIFPSKDQRDWSKWQRPFKDGDVVYANVDDISYILIYYKQEDNTIYRHVCFCLETNTLDYGEHIFTEDPVSELRYASEEEKQRLFDSIRANGYEWNAETKTLEKLIAPKFKVGDSVQSKTDNNDKFTITTIDDNKFYYGCGNGHEFMIPVVKQDNWELVPNKFDPKTLKPFDKVLVRQYDDFNPWCVDFYSYYEEDEGYVICTGDVRYDFCVPYNDDTKHLIGKLDDAPEFYRYWEE